MKRSTDWQALLRAYLAEKFTVAFQWGTEDCCTFACDWIQRATGVDVYEEFRGKYSSQLTSAKALQAVTGTAELEAAAVYVTGKFAMPEVALLMARRGDVVFKKDDAGERLGIVHLNGRDAVFLLESGWKTEPLNGCQRTWRV